MLVSAGLWADPMGSTGPPSHLRAGLTLRQGVWLSVLLGHSGCSKALGMEPPRRGSFQSVAASSPAMRVAVSLKHSWFSSGGCAHRGEGNLGRAPMASTPPCWIQLATEGEGDWASE